MVKYRRDSIDVTEAWWDSWWYPAAEVEAVLEEARDVAILLKAHMALTMYPKFLVNDPDYVKATRLLALLEVQP